MDPRTWLEIPSRPRVSQTRAHVQSAAPRRWGWQFLTRGHVEHGLARGFQQRPRQGLRRESPQVARFFSQQGDPPASSKNENVVVHGNSSMSPYRFRRPTCGLDSCPRVRDHVQFVQNCAGRRGDVHGTRPRVPRPQFAAPRWRNASHVAGVAWRIMTRNSIWICSTCRTAWGRGKPGAKKSTSGEAR